MQLKLAHPAQVLLSNWGTQEMASCWCHHHGGSSVLGSGEHAARLILRWFSQSAQSQGRGRVRTQATSVPSVVEQRPKTKWQKRTWCPADALEDQWRHKWASLMGVSSTTWWPESWLSPFLLAWSRENTNSNSKCYPTKLDTWQLYLSWLIIPHISP